MGKHDPLAGLITHGLGDAVRSQHVNDGVLLPVVQDGSGDFDLALYIRLDHGEHGRDGGCITPGWEHLGGWECGLKVLDDLLVLMRLVAGLIAAVMPARLLPWAFGLVVAAALLTLEANAFRVAGIAIGLQHLGTVSPEAKDWVHVGTLGLAIAQLAGLGRLIARFTVKQAPAPLTL